MAGLTAARNTPERSGAIIDSVPVKAATKVYVNSLCSVDSSGWGVPASDTAGQIVLGRCEGTPGPGLTGLDADNSGGANGAVTMNVKRGAFKFDNGTAGEAFTVNDIGKNAKVVDDHTVGKVGGTNGIVVGTFLGLDDAGASAWVQIKY